MRVDLRHLLSDTPPPGRAALGAKPSGSNSTARRPRPVPSVDTLLLKAQREQAAKHWERARDTYEELIHVHPKENAASHARVVLGNLLLDKLLQPATALDHFNAYLSLGTLPLTEEALYGKARALRALGRSSEEETVLRAFVHRFPNTMNTKGATERLRELMRSASSDTKKK